MKCAVRLCPNKREEGQFDGPICVPCLEALRGRGVAAVETRILRTIIEAMTGISMADVNR